MSCIKALKTIFGAVPINVDIPPIVAAYAIPRSRAVSKFDLSFSVPVEFSAHLIVDEINKLLSKNENEIEIFDDFQHENSRNLGIRIVTRSYEKTYDDNETRQILMKISDSLEAKFKITLNSGNND